MSSSTVPEFDVVIAGGYVLDESGKRRAATIAVRHGRIAGVFEPDMPIVSRSRIAADGLLVTPGLIDLHTHVFHESTYLGVPADSVGVDQGVTTIVDAGSAGALSFDDFQRTVIDASRTRVLSFINVSDLGLTAGPTELTRLADVGTDALRRLLEAEAHRSVRGIKARMSSSVVGENGVQPLVIARALADEFSLPIMVHVGNEPPRYSDVLDLLVAGDVVSHAFHGKHGGLFSGGATVVDAARRARERGVLFDVGHGSASFSFDTVERALEQGFAPDLASTDLHNQNLDEPVGSLGRTLTKLVTVGIPLPEVIAYATGNAAAVLGERDTLGSLAVGAVADLSLIDLTEGTAVLTDSEGATRTGSLTLSPVGAIRNGVDLRQKEMGARA
jgi:dihydroorotase